MLVILLFDPFPKDYCLSERFYTVKNNFGCIEDEFFAMSIGPKYIWKKTKKLWSSLNILGIALQPQLISENS